jgi:autotransporter-associated beta strand protein
MKIPRFTSVSTLAASFALFLLAAGLPALPAHGAALSWTTSGSGVVDGSGTWDGSNNTWWNGTTATPWSDGSDAVFGAVGGVSGTVTLGNLFTPTVDNIIFNQGYTIASGGTIQLSGTTQDSATNTSGTSYSVVTVASGNTATINSALGGNGNIGLSVNAAGGELILGTGNSFTGGILLNSGTLGFFEGPNLGATPSSVSTQLEFTGNSTLQATANITTAVNYHRGLLIDNGVTATFDTQGFTVLLNDAISAQSGQTGVLNKIGSGTLYLGNDNSSSNANPDQDDAFLTVVMTSGTLGLNKGASNAHAVGGGGLTVNGGVVQLTGTTGDQIYDAAPVTVNGGTFDMDGKSETIGSLMAAASGGTVTNSGSATSVLTVGGNDGATGGGTYAGAITDNASNGGALSVVMDGSAALTLSGASSYSGSTTINNGTVIVSNTGSLGTASSVVNLNGGTLEVNNGNFTGSNWQHTINVGAAGGTLDVVGNQLNINNFDSGSDPEAYIEGSGTLTVTGGGVLCLSSTQTETNFTGNWVINSGVVQAQDNINVNGVGTSYCLGSGTVGINSGGWLSDTYGKVLSNAIVLNGGTIGFDQGSGGNYTGPVTLTNNSTLALRDYFDSTSYSGGISGSISGTGGITISAGNSPATAVFAGADSYSGITAISSSCTLIVSGSLTGTKGITVGAQGTLQTNAPNALNANAALTLNSGTFDSNALNEVLGSLFSTGSSTFNLGTGASVVAFANSSGNTWSGTLTIQNWNGSSTGGGADQIFFDSNASGLSGSEVADILFLNPTVNGVSETGLFDGTILSSGEIVAAIPEPGTFAAVALGLACLPLGWFRRKGGRNRADKSCIGE